MENPHQTEQDKADEESHQEARPADDPIICTEDDEEERIFNNRMADHQKGGDEEDLFAVEIPAGCLADENARAVGDPEHLPDQNGEGGVDFFGVFPHEFGGFYPIHEKDDGGDENDDLEGEKRGFFERGEEHLGEAIVMFGEGVGLLYGCPEKTLGDEHDRDDG